MPADRIAVDANVLVYALYRDAPQHAASRAFLERAQRGDLTLCFTSQTLAEFFSIVTSARRVSDPRTPQEAVGAIQSILALPGATLLPVPADVTSRWLDLLSRHPVRAGAIFDLQLVATITANGVERICTFNRQDFEGFPGLQILTP
ncbi:MAG: type II toxin-antitoxin system VapC family toxin [Terriglobia bacterium]|jgi:toxin-antitoxin system PIN domain toxin